MPWLSENTNAHDNKQQKNAGTMAKGPAWNGAGAGARKQSENERRAAGSVDLDVRGRRKLASVLRY